MGRFSGFPPLLLAVLAAMLVATAEPRQAFAVSCTMSPAMSTADRAALQQAASRVASSIAHGDTTALRAISVPQLAADFSGVAGTVASVAPALAGSTVTVEEMYGLDASDLKSDDASGKTDEVQFFCSVPASQLLVTVTLNQLPAGRFALALVHATGVREPQQFALILENRGATGTPNWQLAGLVSRPLTLAGHDSLWYWTEGRALKARNSQLSAFLYLQTAAYLARPADLYNSNNLDKLSHEIAATEPPGLPGNNAMSLQNGTESFSVTGLSCDGSLGTLDLRVDAKVASTADPVVARRQALSLMAALLQRFPELRQSFHGIWVYESTASGGSFAVEQPMSALP